MAQTSTIPSNVDSDTQVRLERLLEQDDYQELKILKDTWAGLTVDAVLARTPDLARMWAGMARAASKTIDRLFEARRVKTLHRSVDVVAPHEVIEP